MSEQAAKTERKDSGYDAGESAGAAHGQGGAGAGKDDGAGGDAAVKRIAGQGAITDLGELGKPGAKLSGTIQTLKPGASLRFSAGENQIYGVQQMTATGPVTVDQKLLRPMKKGELGNQNLYQYTLTMSPSAKPGEESTVQALAGYQSRDDKDYQFTFHIKCE